MKNSEIKTGEERGWLAPVAIIWVAYAITCFVAIATVFSMGWHVTSTTGDPMAIAAVTVCGVLPQGLLAPFGGVVADRFNRKSILLACYAVIVVAALATAGIILVGRLSLPVILAFSLVLGMRNGFRDPAFNALMPMLVPEKHLIRINMLDNLLSAASMILAPALGILLYTTFGLSAPMVALAIGSALSMLTLAAVSVPTVRSEAEVRLRDEFTGGFRVIAGHRGMLVLVGVFVVGIMAYGSGFDVVDDVRDIALDKLCVFGVENVIKGTFRTLNLRRKKGFLSDVHCEIHLRIRHEAQHAFKLTELS
ncbi:MAG: MFS transporter [Eggerthellaceae bacterium]|nr:MFS transporter [Eggerthellaceae bacterium]